MPAETESSRLLRREVAGGVLRPPFRSFLDAVSILEYAMYECFALLVAILKHRRALLRAAAHTRLRTCSEVIRSRATSPMLISILRIYSAYVYTRTAGCTMRAYSRHGSTSSHRAELCSSGTMFTGIARRRGAHSCRDGSRTMTTKYGEVK